MRNIRIENIDYPKYESRIKVQGLVGGSRPRLVLTHKTTKKKYIFKSYLHKTTEVISECLASYIGKILGINIQQVSIRRLSKGLANAVKNLSGKMPDDWVPVGTLASNIFPKSQEIKYGATIVGTPNSKLTLAQIEEKVRQKYYAPDDLLQDFARMVIFDAIIGNMDRHHENWGVVETETFRQQIINGSRQDKTQRHFTPLYDHGSSLIFELDENKIDHYLDNQTKFKEEYILGKKYSFILNEEGLKENIFKIIKNNINNRTAWGKRFIKAIKEINKNCNYIEIAKKVIQMPSSSNEIDFSDKRKELILRSIILRLEELFSMI